MEEYFANIDWAGTGAMLGGIGSILAALAIGAGVFQAARSVQNWKEQESFKEDRRLAIDILAAFEDGKQNIKEVRSPATTGAEHVEVERRLNELIEEEDVHLTEAQRTRQIKRLTVLGRVKRRDECWSRVVKLLPLAKAVFSQAARDKLFEIIRVRNKIINAANMFPGDPPPEMVQRFEAVIWDHSDDNQEDEIAAGLTTTSEQLAAELMPFVRPSSTTTQ